MTITETTPTLPVWLNPAIVPDDFMDSMRETTAALEELAAQIGPRLVDAQKLLIRFEADLTDLPDGAWDAARDSVGVGHLEQLLWALNTLSNPDPNGDLSPKLKHQVCEAIGIDPEAVPEHLLRAPID